MSLHGGLISLLLSESQITDMVGLNVFVAGEVPQGTTGQVITVQKIADPGHYHLTGASDIANPTGQLDVWTPEGMGDGEGSIAHQELVRRVRALLDGRTREQLGGIPNATIRDMTAVDGRERPGDGSDEGDLRTTFTFTIWHARSSAA